jgi:hypothetical protein
LKIKTPWETEVLIIDVNMDIIYLSSCCHVQNSATVRHPKLRQIWFSSS